MSGRVVGEKVVGAKYAYLYFSDDYAARPDVDEVWLVKTDRKELSIPWPKGMTVLEAIAAWKAS